MEELDEEYADSIREMSLDEYDDVRLTESEGLFSITPLLMVIILLVIGNNDNYFENQ